MRLHLGCGDVYLVDEEIPWINIDLMIPGYSFLATERPDLVEHNATTLDRYYKHPYTTVGPLLNRLCVADAFMDVRYLLYGSETVEEILSVQILEHFDFAETAAVLREWYRVLRRGGLLCVDVPDFEALSFLLAAQNTEDAKEYYYRMIFGSQKNVHAYHKNGFTEARLFSALSGAGFDQITRTPNFLNHPYPSVTMSALKGVSDVSSEGECSPQ
jgi:hypothetical protein